MEAEIELTIDKEGNPILSIKHHDKSDALEQKLLGVFIDRALACGLKMRGTTGILSDHESWEKYEICNND